MEQLLNGEIQRCLQEQIAAVRISKQFILQEHILLDDTVSDIEILVLIFEGSVVNDSDIGQ